MLIVETTTQFRKEVKKAAKSGRKTDKLKSIIKKLEVEESPPPKNRDHALKGNYVDCRECHIEPDWLLIYMIDGDVLRLIRTGSHSELFQGYSCAIQNGL
jgi:mRNA interferase YafQ